MGYVIGDILPPAITGAVTVTLCFPMREDLADHRAHR